MEKQGYTIFTGPIKNGPKGKDAVKIAERNGQQVQIIVKNKYCNKNTLDNKYVAKMLDDDQNIKIPTMPHELRIAIGQARNQKGLTQQKFAQLLNVPKSDVNSWQNGKSVPSGNMIAKMDKILGVKLPRTNKK